MKRHLAYTVRWVALICALILSCCATPLTVDPEFHALMATAEVNPNPNRIVGLWHRRDNQAGNWAIDISTRGTMLFRSDGTGLSRFVMRADGEVKEYEGPLKWSYQGQGGWEVRSLEATKTVIVITVRCSGKYLLFTNKIDGRVAAQVVYFRAE